MISLFHKVSHQCSKITTEGYSTSFSSAIRMLHADLRMPVYDIYGFVRFADEIVDTFHDFDKETLLAEFKKETYEAIQRGISLNPILHSFQMTVNEYKISYELIEAFFKSMEMEIMCYQKGELNLDFYRKQFEKVLKPKPKKENNAAAEQETENVVSPESVKTHFIAHWKKLYDAKKLAHELAIIDAARKKFCADLYKRIEELKKLQQVLVLCITPLYTKT